MNDTKSTLSIDQSEWRVLFAATVQRLQEFIGQNLALSAEHLPLLLAHLERAKMIARAWERASPQAVQEPVIAPVVQTNGASLPKRRGRPPGSGKKREVAQVVQ